MSRGFRDADSTVELSAQAADAAIEKVRAEERAQAKHAAERAAAGTRGICESCGARIPPERLEAVPEATRCVSCEAQRSRASGIRR
ncbi:MAG TPA: TraR/DksA C4-type zinc finger protein [Candidatus Dormibacteraeota bacterium]